MTENYEFQALQYLNKLITLAENNNFKELKKEHLLITKSIFYDYVSFANALFRGDELQFIPLYITTQIGIKTFGITKSDYGEYLQFIYNHQSLFQRLHELLRKMYFKEEAKEAKDYDESIKQILLGEATIHKSRPINLNSLVKSIYNKVYNFPYLPSPQDMYNFYIRNITGTAIKSKVRVEKRPYKESDNKQVIKIIPWKSKRKANDYMEKRGWSDLDKELARNRLENDYFSIKKNLQYQVHLVAPRHTLIIDLFFPGRFVYLLAVNVNTRKAFAIPSPIISKINNQRWNIPQEGHKTVGNVMKMFNQLLAKTPIKMIYCDYEPAFISREFKRMCESKGIKLNTYQINTVEELTTNNGKKAVHGALSVLDRLCRTLRNMAYNIGVLNQEIDPDIMNYLINEYNNSPHTSFYKIFKKEITPNQMDLNKELEDWFCYHVSKRNFIIKNSKGYNIKCPVRVMNNAAMFDKLKHKLLPGIFTIEGKEGGLFICKQGNTVLKVPRWMIRPA